MLESLPKPEDYRTTEQIGDLQVKLEMTVQRVLNQIDAVQKQVADLKTEIANRWKKTEGLLPQERNRIEKHELASRAREMTKSATAILDVELKKAYLMYQEVQNAKPFYPSKLQFLMNSTLDSHDRQRYCQLVAAAGSVELMGYAAHAIATQNLPLGAAVLQANDAQPGKNRRFVSAEISNLIEIPAWESLQKAFKYSDTQFQQALLAIRVFKSARYSAISTLHLAKLEGKTQLNPDGSMKTESVLGSPFTQS